MEAVGELTLEAVVERAERLVARSPADATSVAWIEGRRGSALESASSRHADAQFEREVLVRVRVAGRTGSARAAAADAGDLERTLRSALAAARASVPSPDWDAAAVTDAPALEGLSDPAVRELEPPEAQRLLREWADRWATLRLAWRDDRCAVAASFHATRATQLTEVTLEARTGRRPGSGFAAGSSRSWTELAPEALIERARRLETEPVNEEVPARPLPVVLAPEAALALLDAFARLALSALRTAGESGLPAVAAALDVDDLPLAARGLPLPFDLDGCPKRNLRFVERGRVVAQAFDLDLAARAGRAPTGHGLGSDDAWPLHLSIAAGEASEAEIAAGAGDGLRIGALEGLVVSGGPALEFRARACNVRRIGTDGGLGVALAPMIWRSSLVESLGAVDAVAREVVVWAPSHGFHGAPASPALRLATAAGFAPEPGVARG